MRTDNERKTSIRSSCKDQNKKQLQDKEIQEAYKNVLLQIRDLFEDLKVVISDSVKKFIFENIYKNLGIIESSYYDLLSSKHKFETDANDLRDRLQRENAQHKWEKEVIQHFAEEEKRDIKNSHLFDEEDKALASYFPKLSNEINLSIPDDEMSAYLCFLNGPNIYSFASSGFDLSCGYGKLVIDPEKEAIWKKSQEEAKIEIEAMRKKQELYEQDEQMKKAEEDEDVLNAQQIANEASSFLAAIDAPTIATNNQGLTFLSTWYDKCSDENNEYVKSSDENLSNEFNGVLDDEKERGAANAIETAK